MRKDYKKGDFLRGGAIPVEFVSTKDDLMINNRPPPFDEITTRLENVRTKIEELRASLKRRT